MDYMIREMKQEEYPLLDVFLYEAIYIPESVEPPPRSVFPDYRGRGIGTALLRQLLSAERLAGCKNLSLSVQKSNYAVKLYQKMGGAIVGRNRGEYIMAVTLQSMFENCFPFMKIN